MLQIYRFRFIKEGKSENKGSKFRWTSNPKNETTSFPSQMKDSDVVPIYCTWFIAINEQAHLFTMV